MSTLSPTEMSLRDFFIRNDSGQIPLPTGEGAYQEMGGRVSGTVEKFPWYPSPGPPTRATLSPRERDSSATSFYSCPLQADLAFVRMDGVDHDGNHAAGLIACRTLQPAAQVTFLQFDIS